MATVFPIFEQLVLSPSERENFKTKVIQNSTQLTVEYEGPDDFFLLEDVDGSQWSIGRAGMSSTPHSGNCEVEPMSMLAFKLFNIFPI